VLEAMAVRMSNPSTSDLDDLERLNAALANVGTEPEQAIAANFAWHERLIETCPNTRLVAMVRALWLQVRRYEFAFYAPGKARVRRSVDLHRGIADALRRHASAEAATQMEDHWLADLGELLPRIGGDSHVRSKA
jgi:DNA-binding GntR family transcriptional regulator